MNEQNDIQINPYASPQAVAPAGEAWLRTGGQSLRKVAQGISLVYYGIVLALFAIIVVVLAVFLSTLLQSPVAMANGAIIAGVILVVAGILNLAGPIVCLAVPPKTRARGLITGSVVCQLINLAVGCIVQVAQRVGGVPQQKLIPFQLGSTVIGTIAFILFILFIMRLAKFVGRQDLTNRASSVMNTWIGFVILMFVGTIIIALGNVGGLIVLIPALVFGLVVLLMYVRLLQLMKKALEKAVKGKAS